MAFNPPADAELALTREGLIRLVYAEILEASVSGRNGARFTREEILDLYADAVEVVDGKRATR